MIFNYESTRILAKTGAKRARSRERTRGEWEGKEKKGKNRKTIDERFNRGLPSSRNRVDLKRMHFSREPGATWPLLKFVSKLELRRGEMKFRSAEEMRSRMTNFFLKTGGGKKKKRKRREKRNISIFLVAGIRMMGKKWRKLEVTGEGLINSQRAPLERCSISDE